MVGVSLLELVLFFAKKSIYKDPDTVKTKPDGQDSEEESKDQNRDIKWMFLVLKRLENYPGRQEHDEYRIKKEFDSLYE